MDAPDVIGAKDSRKSLPWAVFHAVKAKGNCSGGCKRGTFCNFRSMSCSKRSGHRLGVKETCPCFAERSSSLVMPHP